MVVLNGGPEGDSLGTTLLTTLSSACLEVEEPTDQIHMAGFMRKDQARQDTLSVPELAEPSHEIPAQGGFSLGGSRHGLPILEAFRRNG